MSDGFEELVTILAIAAFHGQPGEGQGGIVSPGDVLLIDRRRAAELRANGLVRDAQGGAEAGGRSRTVSVSAANSPNRVGSREPRSGSGEIAAGAVVSADPPVPARALRVSPAPPRVARKPQEPHKP